MDVRFSRRFDSRTRKVKHSETSESFRCSESLGDLPSGEAYNVFSPRGSRTARDESRAHEGRRLAIVVVRSNSND